MILTCIPYREDKNLFKAYDEIFDRAWDGDYLAILDHDVMFTENYWMAKIRRGITEVDDGKFFVGYCNRVACKWQVPEDCSPGDSYREHRDFALKQHWDELAPYQVKGLKKRSVIDRTGRAMLSGFFMVIRKDHWMEMKPFIQTKLGCLGLDNELHKITQDLGVKVWQLPIYLYHWYRGATGDKTHLL